MTQVCKPQPKESSFFVDFIEYFLSFGLTFLPFCIFFITFSILFLFVLIVKTDELTLSLIVYPTALITNRHLLFRFGIDNLNAQIKQAQDTKYSTESEHDPMIKEAQLKHRFNQVYITSLIYQYLPIVYHATTADDGNRTAKRRGKPTLIATRSLIEALRIQSSACFLSAWAALVDMFN